MYSFIIFLDYSFFFLAVRRLLRWSDLSAGTRVIFILSTHSVIANQYHQIQNYLAELIYNIETNRKISTTTLKFQAIVSILYMQTN